MLADPIFVGIVGPLANLTHGTKLPALVTFHNTKPNDKKGGCVDG